MVLWVMGLKLVVPSVPEKDSVVPFRGSQCSQIPPLAGWPSPPSTHCHKLCISLGRMLTFSWLLGRRSLRQPSASDSPKSNHSIQTVCAFIVIVGPISMPLASSTRELSSLSSPVCPVPPWQVVIVWVLYIAQYEWHLSPIFPSMVMSDEYTCSLLLVQCPVMCRAFYISSVVESLARQEWLWACCCSWPSSWSSSCEVLWSFTWQLPSKSVSTNLFHVDTVPLQGLSSLHQCKDTRRQVLPLLAEQ